MLVCLSGNGHSNIENRRCFVFVFCGKKGERFGARSALAHLAPHPLTLRATVDTLAHTLARLHTHTHCAALKKDVGISVNRPDWSQLTQVAPSVQSRQSLGAFFRRCFCFVSSASLLTFPGKLLSLCRHRVRRLIDLSKKDTATTNSGESLLIVGYFLLRCCCRRRGVCYYSLVRAGNVASRR